MRLVDLRPGERRGAALAFTALGGITGAHALLETARDALFLAKLPASQLPWVYLLIAAAGVALSRLGGKRRTSLPWSLLGAALVTAAFFALVRGRSVPLLYALYVWSGLFASWVVLQFWLLLSERYTVVQAKRLFGFIGAGSVLGAVAGAALARGLAVWLPAEGLLLAAAALLALTAVGPAVWLQRGAAEAAPPQARRPLSLAEELRTLRGQLYLRRILNLGFLSTLALTTADYVFKAVVARTVPATELGAFFANVALATNGAALLVQLLLVAWLFRVLGVHRATLILPALVLLASLGLALGPGLVFALALKGVDGSLRHSLHKTSLELLYVPIPDALRGRMKPLIDLLSQRGGQAVASVAILLLVAAGLEERWLAAGVVLASLGWGFAALRVRKQYLALFRENLRAGRLDERGDLPPLDLNALEALFGALNSQRDAEVLCALDLLAAQERRHLIPALILYHPSRAIVVRALELLTREGREDFLPIADRLLDHADAEVRAAALRARARVAPDVEALRGYLEHPRPELRATALVALASRGETHGEDLDRLVEAGDRELRLAVARAIAEEPGECCDRALRTLIRSGDPEIVGEAALAMGRSRREYFIAELLPFLSNRVEGEAARAALVELGPSALAAVTRLLEDPGSAAELRESAPRAVARFGGAEAAAILLRALDSTEGPLHYRVLRGLQSLRVREPELPLDHTVLDRVLERTLRKAFRALAERVILQGAARLRTRPSSALELMITWLRDKESHAVGRLFRLLGLRHPEESFERIQRGFTAKDPRLRAAGRELLENVVGEKLRAPLLLLLDDLGDDERVARAPEHLRMSVRYEALVEEMGTRPDALAALARYHGVELGLAGGDLDPEAVALALAARTAARPREASGGR